ncbi:MAG: EI24 domain-containing protein [Pseudomonadota bacterium]
MQQILDALLRALRDLFQFKVLWVIIWPMLAAVSLWAVLGIVFWDTFSEWIGSGLTAIGVQTWLTGIEPRWVANGIQAIAHFILFVPLIFITALIITALFAMPALIKLVADRDYPGLERNNGGGIAGSLINAAIAIAIFVAIWTLTLPLWLLGIGVFIPFVAAAYLNQRLFRYDALAEHVSHTEMRALTSDHRLSWWGLGLLTGLLQFIPLLNLLAPVLTALTFIHFGMARLANLRQSQSGKNSPL